jgi:hypothetical protein
MFCSATGLAALGGRAVHIPHDAHAMLLKILVQALAPPCGDWRARRALPLWGAVPCTCAAAEGAPCGLHEWRRWRTGVPGSISCSKMRSVSAGACVRCADSMPSLRCARIVSTSVLSAYMCPTEIMPRAMSSISGK